MHHPFKKNLLASLIGLAFFPAMAHLDFAQSPPGTVSPFVAPNVILSLDDSGSMTETDMTYQGRKRTREYVLRDTLLEVFNDKTLLPNGSIRFAWQSLAMAYNYSMSDRKISTSKGVPITGRSRFVIGDGGCTAVPGLNFKILGEHHIIQRYDNSIAILDNEHRQKFLDYMDNFGSCDNTPTPVVMRSADLYMRAALDKNGPWADIPGELLASAANNNKPLGCRRNYHILLTDGEWNVNRGWNTKPVLYSNQDSIPLPNGVVFSKNNPQTQIYRSQETPRNNNNKPPSQTATSSSVADWALYSWAVPLQPTSSLEGNISPTAAYENAPATETVTNHVTQSSFSFEKFWNPKYNPANWPHMTTFTIGFSDASLPSKNFPQGCTQSRCTVTMVAPSTDVPYADDGNLADYANGTYHWRVLGISNNPNNNVDRQQDMWRGAINGRGKFYAVREADDLKKAFTDIVQTIQVEVQPAISSAAASGLNVTRKNTGLYTATYDPTNAWTGSIAAQIYRADNQSAEADWDGKTTADKLDELSDITSRLILTSYTSGYLEREGTLFSWDALDEEDQEWIGSLDDTPVVEYGKNIVDYVRGDHDLEGSTAEKPFRKRSSRQGDIVNSDIWYLGRPEDITNISRPGYAAFSRNFANRHPMIYVGGNDGMLHGFSAQDGTEKIAYVPHGLFSELHYLTQPAFNNNHRYFVDGSPFSGDVFDQSWKTMLVGTLGAGGKGYFVLDVTDPDAFTEANASNLVVKDMTLPPGFEDAEELGGGYLGHIFAKPVMDDDHPQRTVQIAQLNNGRYAAILGNGYNSRRRVAALIIQYLDGDKGMFPIWTNFDEPDEDAPSNGLSAPRLVDINGDGRPDVVYAGDLHGNLWKFLINTEDDWDWKVADWHNVTDNYGRGPLFTANRGSNYSSNVHNSTLQAIMAAPSVKISERSKKITENGVEKIVPTVGMMVSFGTGRNITKSDPEEQQQQTLYSVLDNTSYKLEKDAAGKPTGRVLVCDTQDASCDNIKTEDLPHAVTQDELIPRSIPGTPAYERDSRQFWNIDDTTELDFAEKKGWYMDFPMARERLVKNMSFYAGTNMLMVMSQVPAKGSSGSSSANVNAESCEGGSVDNERQYASFINIQDGKAFSEDILKGGAARLELPGGAVLPLYATGGSDPSDPDCEDCAPVLRLLNPSDPNSPTQEDAYLPRVEPFANFGALLHCKSSP